MSAEPQSPSRNFFATVLTTRHFTTMRIAGVLLIAAIAIGAVGFGMAPGEDRAQPKKRSKQSALTVETIAVQPVSSIEISRTYSGVIKAARTSDLSFERTAKLVSVAVEEGARVEQGQQLAQLDKRNLEAKRDELQAQRVAAVALLAELKAGPRKEVIAAARAEVEQWRADLALQKANLQRTTNLVRKNAVSQADYDHDVYSSKSHGARLEAAQHRLAELEEGTRQEKIDAQEAVVAQLDAALDDIAIDIQDSTLTAPFSGTVAKRYVDEGAIVAPSSPVIRLVEDQKLEAWIGLPATTAHRFREGQRHAVRVGSWTLGAIVSAVLPELDTTTRTRTVVLKIDSADSRQTFPGEIVRMVVDESSPMEGFWIPTASLARGSRGLWSTYVVESDDPVNHVVARRAVEVLHTDGDRSLVRGTLQPGDQVITGGTHRVVPGQIVQVQPVPISRTALAAGS